MDHHEPSAHKSTASSEKTDLNIPLAIVFSGMLIAAAIIYTDKTAAPRVAQQGQAPAAEEETVTIPESVLAIKADDHVFGNPDADVIIIEYSDVQCPFCQRFHDTMNMVMESYGGEDGIAWVYRHFPLDSIHPYARKGGEALECANEQGGIEKFVAMENSIFAPETASVAPEDLPALAAAAGLDKAAFTACLTSGKYEARVDRDYQEGASIGVRGTPYSIAWNKKTKTQQVVNGAQAYTSVSSVLESLGAQKTQ
jgi:protein-disulfide isomerase